jgi:universal stress protein E
MQVNKILVVFDPTSDYQPALERAALIAGNEGNAIHLFSCIYDDLDGTADEDREIENLIALQQEILDEATKHLVEQGLQVSTAIEWNKNWYEAVVKASKNSGVEAVIKASHKHSATQRLFKKTSDWTLIRQCDCPVLLVKERPSEEGRKVLAAVDLRGEKDHYEEINANILDFCRRYVGTKNAELHFVNAHKDLSSRPDKGSMKRACGIATENVHIKMGEPSKVIVETADELGANLVVIGNSARSGFSAAVNSNTAEKVLDELECDLLAIP